MGKRLFEQEQEQELELELEREQELEQEQDLEQEQELEQELEQERERERELEREQELEQELNEKGGQLMTSEREPGKCIKVHSSISDYNCLDCCHWSMKLWGDKYDETNNRLSEALEWIAKCPCEFNSGWYANGKNCGECFPCRARKEMKAASL